MVNANNHRFHSWKLLPSPDNDDAAVERKGVYYGAVDVSFPADETQPAVAVYVILDYPSGTLVYHKVEYFVPDVPYRPSYLAFREVDPLVRLVRTQRQQRPDLTPRALLVDGNGLLHPRKAGLACFVGVRTGLPTIGVGKTLFYEGQLTKEIVLDELEEALRDAREAFLLGSQGTEDGDDHQHASANVVIIDQQSIPKTPAPAAPTQTDTIPSTTRMDRGRLVREMACVCRGFAVPLTDEHGDTVACALVGNGGRLPNRTTSGGTKTPIYISVGHQISLVECVRICASLSWTRIPEPVRQADLMGRELLRAQEERPSRK